MPILERPLLQALLAIPILAVVVTMGRPYPGLVLS